MKVFESYTEFYNYLKDNDTLGKNTIFSTFIKACSKINKGCGCSKQRRVDHATSEY